MTNSEAMSSSVKSALAQNRAKVRLVEAHDPSSIDLVRTTIGSDGESFHGVWVSGLTQTTYLGIPDTEMITPLERASLITYADAGRHENDESRKLCWAFDADSGGPRAEIPALVAKLSSMGISMAVIEDKEVSEPGAKVNSLAASSASQGQANMHEFSATIMAFKEAAASSADFMVTARIESFTTRKRKQDATEEMASVRAALEDALARAQAYCAAGADAIMIHSKSKKPDEILDFIRRFRVRNRHTPIVVVPTTYSTTPEDVLYNAGANVIIYANHLMRAKIKTANRVSDGILATNPGLLSAEPALGRCASLQNFGCLLAKISEMEHRNEAIIQYGKELERGAVEGMRNVLTSLLDSKTSGGADRHIIPVADLLRINGSQVTFKLGSMSWPETGVETLAATKDRRGDGPSYGQHSSGWLGAIQDAFANWLKVFFTGMNSAVPQEGKGA
ncbi:hypothetical protein JDV02_000401 [Purpureocillium takamizusanense]|uniref:Phosphoenolpyruvate phosphomutase n=1 Tax=Purpureocillium takamizusanense TaxID=2060973 RepID=A0A9Q8Q6Z2_9HYPO|nr:uncharacterized protein JDV02_000401 [Purpureocillium takamizusanense]UNI13679.1 hypothetical protein JDV02_000401 [Purpureocillium takamizusanense]